MRGERFRLSANRQFVVDAMRIAARTPFVSAQRRMRINSVVAARNQCSTRPSWSALFTKAFALVADEFPELRTAYMPYVRPHLYRYNENAAIVVIERILGDENVVFPFRIRNPGWVPVFRLSEVLREAKCAPIDTITDFVRILRISALPWPFRQMAWWIGHNSGRLRGNYFGTFVVSSLAFSGAEMLHVISPGITLLSYGIVKDDGVVDVSVTWDHRIGDGAVFARSLVRLEEVLNTVIVQELASAN